MKFSQDETNNHIEKFHVRIFVMQGLELFTVLSGIFYARFHISAQRRFCCKASLRGMLIGLVFAPVVGLLVMLL